MPNNAPIICPAAEENLCSHTIKGMVASPKLQIKHQHHNSFNSCGNTMVRSVSTIVESVFEGLSEHNNIW